MLKKVIVAHNGARDQYEVAKAFNENNLLHKLVTDFHITKNTTTKYFNFTRSSDIPKSQICISKKSAFELLKRKLKLNYSFEKSDIGISNKVINLLKDNKNVNLFLYSHYAHATFEYINKNHLNIKKYLFQLHPHPNSIINILESEFSRLPFASNSLKLESEFSLSKHYIDNLSSEIHLCNDCFVASTFTKKTLIENGGNPNKIHIIPYGVNQYKFPIKDFNKNLNQYLTIIFIGSVVQRKGISDLFEAIKLINSKFVKLIIVGRTFIDYEILKHYKNIDFDLHIDININKLSSLLQKSDVLILPSLAEGFGHVILEAMSSGTLVITTENTCGPDIIDDKIDGYIIPIKSPNSIAEKINELLINKQLCSEMGILASKKADQYQWKNFRNKIISYYNNLSINE